MVFFNDSDEEMVTGVSFNTFQRWYAALGLSSAYDAAITLGVSQATLEDWIYNKLDKQKDIFLV